MWKGAGTQGPRKKRVCMEVGWGAMRLKVRRSHVFFFVAWPDLHTVNIPASTWSEALQWMEKYNLEVLAGLWIRNAGSCTRVEIKVNMRQDWVLELFGMCSQWSLALD